MRQTYFRSLANGASTYFQVRGDGTASRLNAAPWEADSKPSDLWTAQDIAPLSPLCPVAPTKIIGIGRNYRAHARELNNEVDSEPLMFFKPPSSLLAPGGAVELPPESERVDFEAELAVVIGGRCRRVTEERAHEFVFGYCIACDVTARDLQKQDRQWTRAKGFDGFCPIGPEVVSGIAPEQLSVQLRQNGELRQDGNTRDMIFSVPQLVSYASRSMTLEPGDLILTGTPAGVGAMQPGDDIEVTIAGFNALRFTVLGAAQ